MAISAKPEAVGDATAGTSCVASIGMIVFTNWPRSSPAGLAAVWRFTYQRPANSAASSASR